MNARGHRKLLAELMQRKRIKVRVAEARVRATIALSAAAPGQCNCFACRAQRAAEEGVATIREAESQAESAAVKH